MTRNPSVTTRHSRGRLPYLYGLLVTSAMLFLPVKMGVEQAWALLTYEPTEGTVTEIEVVTDEGRAGRTVYRRVVAYEYEIAARNYNGSRLRLGPYATRNHEEVENLVSSYSVGDQVTVYVDPDNAERSFLERRVWWFPYWGTALLLFLLAPLYSWMFRRRKRQDDLAQTT